MSDKLIHVRIGKQLRKEMQKLIEAGVFTNQTEIAREGIRDLIVKYSTLLERENEK